MKTKIALVVTLMSLSGCSGIKGEDYSNLQPAFLLEEYFNGNVRGWGMIQDRSGKVLARFDAQIKGEWEGDEGIFEEVFTYYESGWVQHRKWEISKKDGQNYVGEASDIIGLAMGKAHGNAINWSYEMEVPYKEGSIRLKFDDWMWAMNDGVIINRAYMKKFGIKVAELTVFMQKQP